MAMIQMVTAAIYIVSPANVASSYCCWMLSPHLFFSRSPALRFCLSLINYCVAYSRSMCEFVWLSALFNKRIYRVWLVCRTLDNNVVSIFSPPISFYSIFSILITFLKLNNEACTHVELVYTVQYSVHFTLLILYFIHAYIAYFHSEQFWMLHDLSHVKDNVPWTSK